MTESDVVVERGPKIGRRTSESYNRSAQRRRRAAKQNRCPLARFSSTLDRARRERLVRRQLLAAETELHNQIAAGVAV
jgi:hypothetical protein